MCITFCKREEVKAIHGLLDGIIPRPLTGHDNLPRYYCLKRYRPAHRTNDHSICGRCYYVLIMQQADVQMYEEANYHSICGETGRIRVIKCKTCDRRIGVLQPAEECDECTERLSRLTVNEIDALAHGKLIPIIRQD